MSPGFLQGAADGGSVVLLRRWILYPQTDLPLTSDRRTHLQRVLYPMSRYHPRYGHLCPEVRQKKQQSNDVY